MAVITISRQFGAGGRTLGQKVAQKLDYLFEDDAIIHEIAKKVKVTPQSVKGHERVAGSLISRMITSAISRSYMERLTGENFGYMDDDVYVEALSEVITEFARRDNVVLLGRGGQYILKDFAGAYHVLLVAEAHDRINFLMERYSLSGEKAKKAVADGDRRRANLYARFAKKSYNDPRLYHLSLNMSRIPMDQAVELVCALVAE